ncbi:hypothetical protein KAV67_00925, partial [Candidatus Bipolaricaulota bacterium]|nr:hypothetical protein [Candidatus Bipolaricaulota bacterium]
ELLSGRSLEYWRHSIRDERRHLACLHVDRHRQALGYLAPWTYINREVSLPQAVLDLAVVGFLK